MARYLAGTLLAVATRLDGATRRIGRMVALLGFATVLVCFGSVYLRYAVGVGYTWVQELYTWTHVLLIMLGSGYTLLKGGFVRVDTFYVRLSQRGRAVIDLFGGFVFTLPFVFMVAWYGWPFFRSSFSMGERSQYDDGLPALYLLKASLMVFAVLLAMQAVSGMCRNLALLLDGTGHVRDSEA
jgi:TRAP-type mannitol/chloroaromatic compound transport system permease small subunit